MVIDKKDKTLMSYHCGYCKYDFQRLVGTSSGNKGKGGVSTQVKCPQCNNFLKTWE